MLPSWVSNLVFLAAPKLKEGCRNKEAGERVGNARGGFSKAPELEGKMGGERVGKGLGHSEEEEERDSQLFPTGNTVGAHGYPQWRGQRVDGSLQKRLFLFELFYGSFNTGLGAAQAHD